MPKKKDLQVIDGKICLTEELASKFGSRAIAVTRMDHRLMIYPGSYYEQLESRLTKATEEGSGERRLAELLLGGIEHLDIDEEGHMEIPKMSFFAKFRFFDPPKEVKYIRAELAGDGIIIR